MTTSTTSTSTLKRHAFAILLSLSPFAALASGEGNAVADKGGSGEKSVINTQGPTVEKSDYGISKGYEFVLPHSASPLEPLEVVAEPASSSAEGPCGSSAECGEDSGDGGEAPVGPIGGPCGPSAECGSPTGAKIPDTRSLERSIKRSQSMRREMQR